MLIPILLFLFSCGTKADESYGWDTSVEKTDKESFIVENFIDGFEIPESDDDGYFEGIGDYIDGTNLVNATIVETESLFGDNIDIYPVLSENDIVFLDDNNIVDLRFKLIVRSNIYDYKYALIFNHIISQADYEIGDVNQDGIVNVLDVIGMVQYIIGETNFTDQQLLLADLNGDGGVNVLDIALLINTILGN